MTDGSRLVAGRYRLAGLVGRGGMTDVYSATDERLHRTVAVKLLRTTPKTDAHFRLVFREEAQRASRMSHPAIARVYDSGDDVTTDAAGVERVTPYIVTEFVDGRSLREIIAEGPVAPDDAVHIASQLLTALEYSHRALLVHRDVTPGNIMVTGDGTVKVMDFGISRAASDSAATVAQAGTILGSARYFSPEQARGETIDARTDLYSTGVVLFEMLTGRAPFRADRPAAVAYQHLSEEPVVPSSINGRISPALDAVVLHALNKDRTRRYQTAAEFRVDLETAGAGDVPPGLLSAIDAESALYAMDPEAVSGPEAALRRLAAVDDDERVIRTQTRPPVAWVWAGIALLTTLLLAIGIWVVNIESGPSISTGLSVTVPDVAGGTYDEAAAELTALELQPLRLPQESDTVPEGTIISTEPGPGIRVSPQEQVTVYVSLGQDPTTVPLLEQTTEAEAVTAIEDRGLVYGESIPEYSPSLPAGTVIRSEPEANAGVREGDTVNLIVSNGLVEVPSVVGQPITTATTTLTALLLTIEPEPDYGCDTGEVTAQSLPAGEHPQASEITLTYCAG
ncbi:Stk1 family PASTA domain-containing Ser/Thr kinase [Marisediminicola senii]|uniref:Stk1 family PASTA domain-containing Ser/Thr kinase n=1 Tax=Marisediminicola senii TaxID=2711233 RepID=UPI001F2EC21C|nr:Stk1 family PASTA domain-containing Ser/Thr kinase [Marisediminicola senii]